MLTEEGHNYSFFQSKVREFINEKKKERKKD